TKAFKMEDDVPDEIKTKWLQEIIELQKEISCEINQELVQKEEIILVEGFSRKSDKFLAGRTDSNKIVIIPLHENIKEGDFVKVKINRATHATLFGEYVEHLNNAENKFSLTA
ncbi:MAG: TRAM domain-containing protein, partial [Ignavibacteria bacterium]